MRERKDKRSQLFIRARKQKLSFVAMCVSNQIVRPSRSTAETQPKVHPALPSLSAMISQSLGCGMTSDPPIIGICATASDFTLFIAFAFSTLAESPTVTAQNRTDAELLI
jgi:hypothetical protein